MIDQFSDLLKKLIKNICSDLNKSNRSDEMIDKYVNNKDKTLNNKVNVDKVKRPLSAYMIFCNEMRPKIKKKYPDNKVSDISKKLGKLWKSLKVKDRERYDKLNEKEQNRYRIELKEQSKRSKYGLLSEKSLSVSCINDDEDDNDDYMNVTNLDDSENDNDIIEEDNSNSDKISKDDNEYDEEDNDNDDEDDDEEDDDDDEEDDDEYNDELKKISIDKKKLNLLNLNNELNSIYLDSD